MIDPLISDSRKSGRKIVYIAHPVSGDVEDNLRRAAKWYRWAALKGVIPLMPWFECCYGLDDNELFERLYGIGMDHELIRRLPFDECWLCGAKISEGMKAEKALFEELKIPVIDFTGHVDPPS